MFLYINDSKTVQDLQDRFSKCFPYLKLEFYKEAEDRFKSNLIKPGTFIGEMRACSRSGILDIKSWDKTLKVKQELKDLFGLNVQIFRMHGEHWIPATYSNELTLRQQTELARANAVLAAQ